MKGLSLLLSILFTLLLPSHPSAKEFSKTRILMGTFVEIKAYGDERQTVLRAIDRAFSEMERLEKMMSNYREDSEVSLVERMAPEEVKVSPELFEVVSKAVKVSRLSDGAFDITVGTLGRVWDFEKGRVPERKELEALLPLVDYRKIELIPGRSAIRLERKGMSLTLGGIAKGYIVDRAMEVLRSEGIGDALINAGGDIRVMGKGKRWRIGIQHPRKRNGLLGIIELSNGAVATSGDYERFFIKDGVRYHHILDPRTGMPARGVESVTILAPEAWYADALATAVFVLGRQRGMRLIEGLKGVEGMVVDERGRVWMSPGFKKLFKPL